MSDIPSYFKGDADKDFNVASMKKYVETKTAMDAWLEQEFRPLLLAGAPRVLDAACGIGHVSSLLSGINPHACFLGVDQTAYLIDEARVLCREKSNVSFEVDDIAFLPARFSKAFDLTICWKTLSWLPSYEKTVADLIAVTSGSIYVSSLFYDGDIDFDIKVREHQKEAGAEGFNSYYNIYSLPRFKRVVSGLGAKVARVVDFEIPIDLPRGSIDQMGTYTVPLADGKRLQMSGALAMPWKFIRIDV